MTTNPEAIAELFSVLHDGWIVSHESTSGDLTLTIEIGYLAKRLNPEYRSFTVRLINVRDVRFEYWLEDPAAKPREATSLDGIFDKPLEICEGEVDAARGVVSINLFTGPSTSLDHSGGKLSFRADDVIIHDAGRVERTLHELTTLAADYWNEFRKRGRRTKAD